MTPIPSLLVLTGWHGTSAQWVVTVGLTPKRFRIRAVTRTRLGGRNRWLEPGQEALVPTSAVRHNVGVVPPEVQAATEALQSMPRAAPALR